MTFWPHFVHAFALVVSTSPALPETQPSSALTLDEVISSIERTFPLLKATEVGRELSAADLLSADGGFDASWKTRGTVTPVGYYDSTRIESIVEQPTSLWGTSFFAGWRLGRGEFPVYDQRHQTLEFGEIRAGANIPMWRNGPVDRRRANIARSKIDLELAELAIVEQAIHYRRFAAQRYWTWVAAGCKLAVAELLLRNVEGRDEVLRIRVERGDLAPVERVDNARAIEQRKAQLALANRGLEQAAIELGLIVRDGNGKPSPPSRARLPVDFPSPASYFETTVSADVASALMNRPEHKRLTLNSSQNQIELDWARNQRAPGIDLQMAAAQDLGPTNITRPDLTKPSLEVTLLVDIPIRTRVAQGRIDAASALGKRIEYQMAFTKERIEADVHNAHSAVQRSTERIETTRLEVSKARELEVAERLRFEHGDGHLLFVNIREQQTAEAELRVIDALLDYHNALADLRASRGD